MGGKYLIWWSGKDDIYNTLDDTKRTLYLTSPAVQIYESQGEQEIRLQLIEDIDDNVIEVFHLQYATTAQIGASYQENLEYFLLLGYSREQAVAKAQASVGITKAEMIAKLDEFQKDIIDAKALSITEAEKAIKEQTSNPDFTELNLDDIVNDIDFTRNDDIKKTYTTTQPNADIITAQTVDIQQDFKPTLSSVDYSTVEQVFDSYSYRGGTLRASVNYRLTKDIPTTTAKIILVVRDNKGSIITKRENQITLKREDTINYQLIIGAKDNTRNVNIEHFFLFNDFAIANALKQSVTWYPAEDGDKGGDVVGQPEIELGESFLDKYQLPLIIAGGAGVVAGIFAIARRKQN